MFLYPFYKPIASSALAGVIVTAAFTAGVAVLIYNNCRYFKLSSTVTWLLTLLYCLNPFVFAYGFNGMSEAVFIFMIVLTVTEFICWMEDEKQIRLLIIGLAMALAFLTRYEAIPLCIAVFLALAIIVFHKRKGRFIGFRAVYNYFEGTSIVLFIPVITAVILWLLGNLIIMGDPLYFLHSVYSNESQAIDIHNQAIMAVIGHPLNAFMFEIKKTIVFLPVFVFIILLRIWDKRLFKSETVILVLLVIAIPVFHFIMLLKGASYGWFRFYVYPFPIAVAWLPYELSKIGLKKVSLKPVMLASGIGVMLFSACITGIVMVNPNLAPEENQPYRTKDADLAQQIQIAQYINTNVKQGEILLDSFMTYDVILNLDNTDRVITTCSYEFQKAVLSPDSYNVQYILAVINSGIGKFDAINIQYPDLYDKGASWCTLVKEFNGYKLYKINRRA